MNDIGEKFDQLYQKIWQLLKKPEQNNGGITLYKIGEQPPRWKPSESTPTTTVDDKLAGPRRLTIEEYKKRTKRLSNNESVSAKGGRRRELQRQFIKYKRLEEIAATPEETNKYKYLITKVKKEINYLKKMQKKNNKVNQ